MASSYAWDKQKGCGKWEERQWERNPWSCWNCKDKSPDKDRFNISNMAVNNLGAELMTANSKSE